MMIPKRHRSSVVLAIVGFCLVGQSTFASPVIVEQDYSIAGNPNSRDDLLNTLITATIRYDDGALGGVGAEYIPVNSVDLLFSDRGQSGLPAGLNFASVVDPNVVHLFAAMYIDNDYKKFGWRDDGGALFRARFSPEGPGINLISFTFGGTGGAGQLSFLISNAPRYNFGALGPPRINPVPLPATLPLSLSALVSLRFLGWRKNRHLS